MASAWIVLGLFLNYLLVIFILTVNIIVVVVLVQNASLHSPTNVIIGTLAVADLGYGLNRTVLILLEYKTFRSYWTCLVSYCIAIFLGSVSMHMLVIVSIDRYVLITRPLHYYNIINNTRISIAISCSVVHRVDAETGNSGTNQLAAHLKAAKLFATLCGYFLLSWGPFFAVKYISLIRGRKPLRDELNHVTMFLAVGNSLGNPLIYAFRSVDVKHKLQRMFTSTFNRSKPTEENQAVPTIRVSTEDVE
ncbi:olfactory receptor 4D5-like [Haliotis rubra]|uniref:olfactory receptor 4D5-like n=1 Tax=Haliotis rubra TaxID=36100 RepID=UPI001EE56D0A|nr:olfactory receptor 4D5-like [Haliotis rubra]